METRWSAALFGHDKPRYYVQDKITGLNVSSWVEHPGEMPEGLRLYQCTGVEKRAEPGDVVTMKPDKCWNCDEQQHKDIVGMIKDPKYLSSKKAEMKQKYVDSCGSKDWRPAARFERIWRERITVYGLHDPRLLPDEIKTYFSFLPGASLWHLKGSSVWGKAERRQMLVVDIDGPTLKQWEGLTEFQWDTNSYPEYNPMSKSDFQNSYKGKKLDEDYTEYVKQEQQRCSMPTDTIKKRRFKITLDDLRSGGVDIDRMLDPNIEYVPNVGFSHLACLDKLNQRKVQSSDGLNRISPRVLVGGGV